MSEAHKGILLVISGPSGTGKGTIIEKLMQEDATLVFSVSATTRQPRPGEVDGVHYHFMTVEKYNELVAEDAFVEHAKVHGNFYGTLKSEVNQRIARGETVILDIDVQGALNVIDSGIECVSVFIEPPSIEELRARLVNRGTESPENVERRMNNAIWELSKKDRYQFHVVNDNLEDAIAQMRDIINTQRNALS